MKRIFSTSLAAACTALVMGAGGTVSKDSAPRKVFFDAREHQTEYAGPGREAPAPAGVKEVRIGYFGPSDPSHRQGGDLWRAAQLAVEEANARGGFRGKPFRLVAGWSKNPWGTGVTEVVRMVYAEQVWAIVGGIDGPSTHLAEQVVAKARLTLLSPVSTDKTVNLANVPWMFSCLPADRLQAPLLAAAISSRVGTGPLVLVSADDHDSHLFIVELNKALTARRMVPRYHFECRRASPDPAELVTWIVRANAHAVVLVAGASQSARLVAAIRGEDFSGPIFGGPSMGRRRFLQESGPAAEGVVFPLLYLPGEASQDFAKTFKSRFAVTPDYAAAHTYDAVRLLITAIRKAGLNRARIRDAVKALSPWPGVTGSVTWDSLGGNTRKVRLGTIREGTVVPMAGWKPALREKP